MNARPSAALLTVAVLTVAGCSSAPTASPAAPTASPAVVTAKAPAAKAPATPSAKAAPAKPMQPSLTGFGATTASWDAHHQADPNFTAGSAYDPTPGLAPPGDPTRDDRYYSVNSQNGHITSYSERFAAGTSLASAKAQAMREMPSDAHVLWSATKDTCTQMGVTSARLDTALGANDKTWKKGDGVLVEFTSDAGAYNAASDPEAFFSEGEVSTSQAAAGCCPAIATRVGTRSLPRDTPGQTNVFIA